MLGSKKISKVFLSVSLIGSAWANLGVAASDPELVIVESKNLFVPNGFDDNDEATVVLDGYLPDGCHKLAHSRFEIDANKKINVTQYARRFAGPCIEALVPFTSEVQLGALHADVYTVVTNTNTKISKTLVIKETPPNARADEFTYAPVDAVQVNEISTGSNRKYEAVLDIRYTNNCMVWDSHVLETNGDTIVLRPIIKMLDQPVCEDSIIPLKVAIVLPSDLLEGRYMLHTRSLNGRSINTVFSVKGE